MDEKIDKIIMLLEAIATNTKVIAEQVRSPADLEHPINPFKMAAPFKHPEPAPIPDAPHYIPKGIVTKKILPDGTLQRGVKITDPVTEYWSKGQIQQVDIDGVIYTIKINGTFYSGADKKPTAVGCPPGGSRVLPGEDSYD